ncbi:MAG: YhdP family protein [Betaproteobacteria bacterium]
MPASAIPRWLRISSLTLYRLVTWSILGAGFAFAFLVIALRYWVLPNIDQHRERIAEAITAAIGQRVAIGKVSGNWDGLHPELVLDDVTVFDAANRPALRLSRIDGALSWFSVAAWEPRFRSVELLRPELEVRRDTGGVLHIAGIELKEGEGGGFADWLLRQPRLSVRQARLSWRDELRGAGPLQLQQVDVLVRNRGRRHRFGIRAVPPPRLAGPLEIRGELTGRSAAVLSRWDGRFYVRVDTVDIEAWRPWMPPELPASRGAGALRMWVGYRDDRLADVVADLRLADVQLRLAKDAPEIDIVTLSGRVGWKHGAGGIEASTSGLSFTTGGGLASGPTDFLLRVSTGTDSGAARGELRANALALEPLALLADRLPLDPALRADLSRFLPRGSLFDLAVRWNGEFRAPAQYVARGRFHELAVAGVEEFPGFSGLSGTFDGNEKSGTLRLDSTGVTLDMPRVFRGPLEFERLAADIGWSNARTEPEVQFNKVTFSNSHMAGTAQGNYRYASGGRGTIDVTGSLNRADARYVGHYIPLHVGRPTRDWLDKALVSGQSNEVSLRLKGDLSDFPFPENKGGVFEVIAKVNGGVLDYATGWPRIENIAGDIAFRGKRMEVNARQGTILGAKLLKVRAEIPDLVVDYEVLNIAGEAEGPSAEFLAFIEKSPVLEMIDRYTEGMRMQGAGKLQLKLEIPLREEQKSRLSGVYQFMGNRFVAGPDLPVLEQASGRLEFTESTLNVPHATATFLGGPIVVSSAPPGDATARINVQGRANIGGLRGAMGNAWLMRHVSGGTDWKGTLVLRRKLADLVIESSLQGIVSDLPPPLRKAAAEEIPLRIERRFISQQPGLTDRVDATYGEILSARLVRRHTDGKESIRRATVSFGGAAPEPERDGVWVSGTLKRLDLDQWLALAGDDARAPEAQLGGIEVKLEELIASNRVFHQVAISSTAQEGGWRASLAGRELEGTATWLGQGKGKLTARMKRLVIPADMAAERSQDTPGRNRELPALDVIAEQFSYKDRMLGRLELAAVPVERNWRIDRLRLTNADGALSAEGLVQEVASQPRTRATVHLDVSDVGKFLERLGFPDGVRRGTARLDGTLAWPGAPQDFEYATLIGNLRLDASKGQFVKLEPGFGKLLGILSLQALPRRVTLDFRDVFSEGFAFDQIQGDVSIERGIASTANFRIQGPAARVAMSGEVDLVRETQKLNVRVVPSLSDGVSIAGALLGGPVAGVATILAQKILKDPLDQIFSYEYSVTGTWAEPQVSKVDRAGPATSDAR